MSKDALDCRLVSIRNATSPVPWSHFLAKLDVLPSGQSTARTATHVHTRTHTYTHVCHRVSERTLACSVICVYIVIPTMELACGCIAPLSFAAKAYACARLRYVLHGWPMPWQDTFCSTRGVAGWRALTCPDSKRGQEHGRKRAPRGGRARHGLRVLIHSSHLHTHHAATSTHRQR